MAVLLNFMIIEDGSLIGRRGTRQWNAASLGATAVNGATRQYFTGNNQFLALIGGTVNLGNDATKTFTSSATGFTAGALGWFVQYLNFVYFATTADAPQKWDGTSWTPMGVAAPAGTPAVAVGAAGTPNGTYTVIVTFRTPTVESNGSPASAAVTVANQNVNVSGIPLGPTGTTARGVYGFKNAVSSGYQLIGVINDNTSTTFTVTTDQGSWTTALPTTNNPPVTGAWLTAQFKNRLWKAGSAANPQRLFFSQIFVPESWNPLYFLDVPFTGGDVITALFVIGDILLIFGNTEIFLLIGDTPFSFILRRSYAQVGCPSPWAVDRVENTAVHLGRFGVYAFDTTQQKSLSDPIEPQFSGVFPQFNTLNYAFANLATLRFYDRLKAVVVSFPTGGDVVADTTWWYFFRRQGWAQDSRASRLLLTLSGRGDAGDLYAFDAGAGILRQWDTSGIYDDDTVAITARAKTGVLAGDDPTQTKTWRWFTARARPANVTLQVTATLDQGVQSDSFTVPLNRGAAVGSAVVGTSTIGADVDDFEEAFGAQMRGRGIELDMSVVYTQMVQISQLYATAIPVPAVRRRVGLTG
jgi:hypothetical protein